MCGLFVAAGDDDEIIVWYCERISYKLTKLTSKRFNKTLNTII